MIKKTTRKQLKKVYRDYGLGDVSCLRLYFASSLYFSTTPIKHTVCKRTNRKMIRAMGKENIYFIEVQTWKMLFDSCCHKKHGQQTWDMTQTHPDTLNRLSCPFKYSGKFTFHRSIFPYKLNRLSCPFYSRKFTLLERHDEWHQQMLVRFMY